MYCQCEADLMDGTGICQECGLPRPYVCHMKVDRNKIKSSVFDHTLIQQWCIDECVEMTEEQWERLTRMVEERRSANSREES